MCVSCVWFVCGLCVVCVWFVCSLCAWCVVCLCVCAARRAPSVVRCELGARAVKGGLLLWSYCAHLRKLGIRTRKLCALRASRLYAVCAHSLKQTKNRNNVKQRLLTQSTTCAKVFDSIMICVSTEYTLINWIGNHIRFS